MEDLHGNPIYNTPVMRKLIAILDELKPAQLKVGEFILRNPLRTAMLSISEIGRESDTSPAAVNRLGNRLGMNGFTGLRLALVNHLLEVVSPHLSIVQPAQPAGFSLLSQLRAGQAQAVQAGQHNAEAVFEVAVQALCDAEALYILGGSLCQPLAMVLEQHMVACNPKRIAMCLHSHNDLARQRLEAINEGDVVVVMSLPPYNQDTLALAALVSERGATLLAITDCPASPLSGNVTLYAPSDCPAGTRLVPAFSLVDALIAGVYLRLGQQGDARVQHVQDALQHHARLPSRLARSQSA